MRGCRTDRSVLSCLLEPSLPRNNRLARHSTTLISDEVTHVTPDIPLVDVGLCYLLGGDPPSRLSPDSQTNRQELACGVLNYAILSYQVPPKLLQTSFDLVSDCGRLLSLPLEKKVEPHVKKGSVAWKGYIYLKVYSVMVTAIDLS